MRAKMSSHDSQGRQDPCYGRTLSWSDMAIQEARAILAETEPEQPSLGAFMERELAIPTSYVSRGIRSRLAEALTAFVS